MSIEELQTHAKVIMSFAVRRLREKGYLHLMLHLLMRDGNDEIIPIHADTDAGFLALKNESAVYVRERISQGGVEAVLIVSDTWITVVPGPRSEAVIAVLESPIFCQFTVQRYRRAGGRIVLDGEPVTESLTSPGDFASGRFANFFDHPSAGPPS